ncbi:MAG: GNAT family N-acetyltransferase [Bacillota bacterium]
MAQLNDREIDLEQPILETPRLILRKIMATDLSAIHAFTSLDVVTQYLPFDTHQSHEQTKLFINFVLDQYDNNQLAPWGIELKPYKKLIGMIEYVFWEQENDTAELAFVLTNTHWGRGIVTEACQEVIKYGFTTMKLQRIQARSFVENIGSQKVLEKCGLKLEGILKKRLFIKGKHRDICMYAIIKDDDNRKTN